MVHVCKLSGPQRDLQLPPETVAYLLQGKGVARVHCHG